MIAKAVQKEGPCAPLFCLGIAILLPSLSYGQQTVDVSELERCAAIESTAEKLACFESLTAPPAAKEAEETVEPAVAAEPVPELDPIVESLSPPLTDDVPPAVSAAPVDPAPAAAPVAAVAAEPELTETPEAGPDFGNEQLQSRVPEEKPDTVTARVAEVWKGGNRMLYFQFTNGQIWRQMESDYFYYPKDQEFDITIRQGMMGDYQMRLDGRARMTRIVRVK